MLLQLQQLVVALTSLVTLLQAQAAELPVFDVWLNDLAQCESGGNPNALNPHDPVTRSVGLFQFKDKTFLKYARKYNFYPTYKEFKEV